MFVHECICLYVHLRLQLLVTLHVLARTSSRNDLRREEEILRLYLPLLFSFILFLFFSLPPPLSLSFFCPLVKSHINIMLLYMKEIVDYSS